MSKSKTSNTTQNRLSVNELYKREIIKRRIQIEYSDYCESMDDVLIEYAKKNLCSQCHREGYFSDSNIKVINYSCAVMKSSKILMDVDYELDVFHPYIDMEFDCQIDNITKLGIRAFIEENPKKNPVVAFASRIHNPEIFSNVSDIQDIEDENEPGGYKRKDYIRVKVIGYRFEINDEHVSVLCRIIQN